MPPSPLTRPLWKRAGSRVVALMHPDWALVLASLLIIGFGIWLRAERIGFPGVLTWDEHHFVNNARAYLQGQPDLNDHPPLGKLLIALSMRIRGDNAIAWRIPSLVLGCASIVFGAALAKWATGRRAAFWIAAALIAMDGFLVCYSRTALLDGMLTSLCLASMAFALGSRTPLGVGVGALLLGSACSIKFSAVVLVPILLWAAFSKRRALWALATTPLAPAAYAGWYAYGLRLSHHSATLQDVLSETKRLYVHHAGLNQWTHPALTHWYEWFLPKRPLLLRSNPLDDGRVRMLSSLANPLLTWMIDAAVVGVALSLIVAGIWYLKKNGARSVLGVRRLLDGPEGKRLALLLCWCAPIVPWIVSTRDSYLYHYLPAHAFGAVLVATLIDALYARARMPALVLVLALGQVSLFYAPIWGQLPITQHGVQRRLFLRTWRS